jgi:BCD family chlorophyll transporter-like MFS transporter
MKTVTLPRLAQIHPLQMLHVVRLAGYPLGYGLTGALVGGALNRIMVAELGFSIALVGFFFAMPQLVSPLRVWLGYRSDGFPIWGRRREPYILVGTLLGAAGVVLAVMLAVNGAASSALLTVGVMFAFVLYGLGRNLAHNSYEAFLAERFTGNARPRAMTLFEVVTLLGSVMGAGALGAALRDFDPARLTGIALGTMGVVLVLTILAAVSQERNLKVNTAAVDTARAIPFRQALQALVLADAQVRIFFTLILFAFIGTLAQDVLLEPYGGLVLNMSPSETTRLTAFWGIGVLLAMLLCGGLLLRFFSFLTILRAGLIFSTFAFGSVIFVGLSGNADLFRTLVFIMGFGTGISGAGMLTGLAHFTTTVRAGMLMGVWGMANLLGRASGSIIGGVVVQTLQTLTGSALIGYTAVFAIEVVMILVALGLSFRLRIDQSAAHREEARVLGIG